MDNKLKIIHIASFKGNIGDRINHEGFYSALKKYYKNIEIEQCELRDFYFSAENRKVFDSDFCKHINEFDLCILGGGGFFDCHWEKSNTATSLDLPNEFINNIKIPVLLNSMGYHEYEDSNVDGFNKFKEFLENVTKRPNWFVTLRNDGSFERLNNRYNNEFASKVYKVPDNGFIRYLPREIDKDLNNKKKITLGLCITNDLFSKEYNKNINEVNFNNDISEFIKIIDNKIDKFIFLPHIPQDIQTINLILNNIPNFIKRNKVMVAPFDAFTSESTERIKIYYTMCDCIIGMRFHSVITGVSLNIPTVFLASHAQIEALARELNLSEWFIRIDHENISNELEIMLDKLKTNYTDVIGTYKVLMTDIRKSHKEYMNRINEIIKNRIC